MDSSIITILFSILMCLAGALPAKAQTFTEQLQHSKAGQGTVTVIESKEITDLVNGPAVKKQDDTGNKPADKAQAGKKTAAEHDKAALHDNKTIHHEGDSAKKHEPADTRRPEQRTQDEDDEFNIPTVDMRKKIMRRSRKVTGYRVQAYAGGNSRADRQKAEQAGSNIKMKYPEQPVYVHFYSPRWICRVGNFRTLGEAQTMLKKIKAMGYKSATVVKGTITIGY